MRQALPVLDHVFGACAIIPQPGGKVPPPWTLGGGTALALRIAHRLSDDIDIFVPGRRLKEFTPHANPATKAIADKFQWPGAYLKLKFPNGEIDFLSPVLQTEPGYTVETFRGRPIALETTEEVIIKKIRYRTTTFAARDIFDLAAAARTAPELPRVLVEEVGDALPRLKALVEAKAQAKRGETATFKSLMAERGTTVPRLARDLDIGRAVLTDLVQGRMTIPLPARFAGGASSVSTLTPGVGTSRARPRASAR